MAKEIKYHIGSIVRVNYNNEVVNLLVVGIDTSSTHSKDNTLLQSKSTKYILIDLDNPMSSRVKAIFNKGNNEVNESVWIEHELLMSVLDKNN